MGLKLLVWRKRASAVLHGTRGLIRRGWTKLEWPGRMIAAGFVLQLAALLVAAAARLAGWARLGPATVAGLVILEVGAFTEIAGLVIYVVILLWRAWQNRSPGLGSFVGHFVLFCLFGLIASAVVIYFPVIMAALATSGGISIKTIFKTTVGGTAAFRNRWVFDTEFLCPWAIVALVVIIPQLLHEKLVRRPEFVLPAWLAGFAAVATWLVVFMLYFNGLRPPGGAGSLAVGATFTAVLLAPFYRFLARSCWDRGVAHVFNPRDWWSAWSKAYQELRLAFPSAAVAAKSTQTEDPHADPEPATTKVSADAGRGECDTP
jgi:hypothetical protein